eukprot:6828799-Ditylum_brightwellii.AAC.1
MKQWQRCSWGMAADGISHKLGRSWTMNQGRMMMCPAWSCSRSLCLTKSVLLEAEEQHPQLRASFVVWVGTYGLRVMGMPFVQMALRKGAALWQCKGRGWSSC